VVEGQVVAAELVAAFLGQPLGERGFGAEPVLDVAPAAVAPAAVSAKLGSSRPRSDRKLSSMPLCGVAVTSNR
jgi:hypothetical protein